MGSSFVNYQIRAESAEPVRAAARRACVGLAYVVPARNGWVALYDEASESHDEAMLHQVAHDLSEGLATAVFAFWVHDSDVLRYILYERGELAAEYDSWPDHEHPESTLEGDSPQTAVVRPRPDQLLFFDVGEPRPAPAPGNPEAVLRHCRPGTEPEEVRDLLRQDSWPAFEDAVREGRWSSCPGSARLDHLAELLGIDEHLARLGFRYLEEQLHDEGRRAVPGIRKFRGKGTRRSPRTAGRPRSLAGAVAAGNLEAVRRFLAGGADPNATGEDGDSLLAVAANGGHFEIVLNLLAAGGRPSSSDAVTLFMRAVSFGRPDVVPVLVDAGVDVAAMDHFALFCAVCARSSDRPTRAEVRALEALIQAGADVNARDARGITPLTQAAEAGHREFVEVLLRTGADIDAPGENGRTALICAVMREASSRSRHMVRFLLDAGADPNVRDESGITALLYAVAEPNEDQRGARLVAALLRAGAEADVQNDAGETALSLALLYRREAIAELLRTAGAK